MRSDKCSQHRELSDKISSLSRNFHGLEGKLSVVIPEIQKSSTLLQDLAVKMAGQESERKTSWKMIGLFIALGSLLSGFLWSALSFFQRGA